MRLSYMVILLAIGFALVAMLSDGSVTGALNSSVFGEGRRIPETPDRVTATREPSKDQQQATGTASVALNFTLMERFGIPEGSTLSVSLKDARGANLYSGDVEVGENGPPYRVDVPLKRASAYPLTVNAKLISLIGHRLAAEAELGAPEVSRQEPVELVLRLQ